MDNRITKRRLSDFLAYEWIAMIIVAVLSMLLWEFVYGIGSVKLTPGQQFKFFYDQNVSSNGEDKLYQLMDNKKALSYDILEFTSEVLSADYNVLSVRLSVQEGDVIITDNKEPDENATDKSVRAKSIADNMLAYPYEKMLKDAKTYLRDNFLSDGLKTTFDYDANTEADLDLAVPYENLDQSKIEARFRLRMRKDNRFRTEKDIEDGTKKEKGRISKLCYEVAQFEQLLSLRDSYPDLFFSYTRYTQSRDLSVTEAEKQKYEELIKNQQNLIYGLNVSALKDYNPGEGEVKTNPTEFFALMGSDGKADNVVIMAFDMWQDYQYDLQFETLSFINTIVRQCSDILD